ncbi:penicillin-binding protein [Brevibacillus sp. H7]|uniref:penicillin-binding protein n=1 Tax=Brevibacillus sp. H7 TaxID=3349138 RepID=UPI0038136A17
METKRRVNWRILFLAFMTILVFSGLTVRLWWIQTVDAAWIMDEAKEQWDWKKKLKPKRGEIRDRNGEVLAYEGKAYTVNATMPPRNEQEAKRIGDNYVKDPYYTATKLSPILNVPVDKLLQSLTNQTSLYVELGRAGKKITEEQKKQILDVQYPRLPNGERSEVNQLPGIFLTDTTRRFYPNNGFASHVLGYMTYEDEAKMGIELQLDKELRGEMGELQVLTDAAGYQLPEGENIYKPAKDGLNVYLTIDQQIQDYVEQALDKTEQEYKPKKMTVIVSDPNTGEILAMGNRPQFNPNSYWNIENFTNHAVSSMFEPGSTFKIITLAAAIEEGLFNPNETYQSGLYKKVPGKAIQDHNNGHGWGKITFLEGVQRSSNVAFVILGYERLKQELLSKYFDLFGFTKKTNIDLPYEKKGIMTDLKNPRSPRDVAVTTFGQGVAVTAIQQVAAVGAIANGGELLRPHIIKEMRDPHTGAVVKRNEREVVQRVVSEKTAKQVRDILETVVTGEAGTGKAYNIEGYHVAGKTGTAQKYDEQTGKIMEGRYIVSFIGFAPKDNPRLLVYVVVDDPETDLPSSLLGSKVVAPIFKSVMERSLQYLQQKPEIQAAVPPSGKQVPAQAQELMMPKFVGMSATAAQLRAKKDGFQVTLMGNGTKIVEQYPVPYDMVLPKAKIVLVTDRVKGTKMPDFKGKSLREVMEFASLLHMQVTVSGTGFVAQQSIAPGTAISGSEKLQVTLKPTSDIIPAESEPSAEGVSPPAAEAETTASP